MIPSFLSVKFQIIFENNGLGKYLVSYKSYESDSDDTNKNNNDTPKVEETVEKKSNYFVYLVATVSILTLGGTIYLVKKKKN